MPKVEIYTKSWCPYSNRARAHLDFKGVVYEEIDVTNDTVREMEMMNRSGRHTVPQIFIDDHHVGGNDDLLAAEASGKLDRSFCPAFQGGDSERSRPWPSAAAPPWRIYSA